MSSLYIGFIQYDIINEITMKCLTSIYLQYSFIPTLLKKYKVWLKWILPHSKHLSGANKYHYVRTDYELLHTINLKYSDIFMYQQPLDYIFANQNLNTKGYWPGSYGILLYDIDIINIPPIPHWNARPDPPLWWLQSRVFDCACTRMQEGQPRHVLSQQATWWGVRPVQKGSHIHTRPWRPANKHRARCANQEGLSVRFQPTQQPTRDGS